MSPKNKIKLNFLRKKLDNLDIRLLKIVKERTIWKQKWLQWIQCNLLYLFNIMKDQIGI